MSETTVSGDAKPVVTITRIGRDGTLVRWFRSVGDAQQQRAALAVSLSGIAVYGSLHDVPDAWVSAAREAFSVLADDGDVHRFATHRHQGPENGPLVPVEEGGADG